MRLYSSKIIREEETRLFNSGVAPDVLIERAGFGLAQFLKNPRRVAIIIGSGNNGADGISATFYLLDKGVKVDIFTVGEIKGEYSLQNLPRLNTMGIKSAPLSECEDLSCYDVVVDCIFGIGLNREVVGIHKEAIERINSEARYVVSADIPSGISTDTGKVLGVAVKSDMTVSFSGPKLGYFLSDGLDYVGKVLYADTGILPKDYEAVLLNRVSFPKRRKNTHKGDYGKIAIIGGSAKYVGAPILAERSAKASLRSGAGLVKLCVPYSMQEAYQGRVCVQTLDFLPDIDGNILFDKKKLDEIVSWSDVIVVGMGLGVTDEVKKVVTYLIEKAPCIVLDADALNCISDAPVVLKNGRRVVITPHLGEFSRLIGRDVKNIEPLADAKAFSAEYGVTIHLKGATSVTVYESGEAYVTSSGSPALAKGGSGDVLAGVIASFIGQNIENPVATASFIHGDAGRLAELKFGEMGTLASDLPDKIAESIRNHSQK